MDALLCLNLLTNCTLGVSSPQVTTSFGLLQGHFVEAVDGTQFAAFEGIPYARPPVGKGRFKAPQPIKPWVGTWQAKTLHKCLQYDYYSTTEGDNVKGDEDCLYLNIYTPAVRSLASDLLDVIVFIHGGAFMFHAGHSYGPKIIMQKNIIYINLNYRLGPLGFLSTEDEIVPGNNGIKDQILALRWIKENVVHFGGNPESITLMGMSAGGASVHLHYLSPLSTGLFNRGVAQSGTMLNHWALVENSLEKAKKLSAINGCPTATTREMIECLRHRPAHSIVDSVKHFLPWLYNPFSPFAIVIDKWAPEPVLPEHPYNLMRNKKTQDLPLIMSNVENEGLFPAVDFLAEDRYLKEVDSCWDALVPFILDFNNTVHPSQLDDVVRKIRAFYFKDGHVSRSTFSSLVKMLSDRVFIADIERAARLQSSAMESPVYYYQFSYRGANSKSNRPFTKENFGTSHGDDTVYVLSSTVDTQSTAQDKKMSAVLIDMLLSFASKSVPTLNIEWPSISKDPTDPLEYVKINSPDNIKVMAADYLGNRDFWDTLPIKENKKLIQLRDEL